MRAAPYPHYRIPRAGRARWTTLSCDAPHCGIRPPPPCLQHPTLVAHYDRVRAQNGIATYMKSDKRLPNHSPFLPFSQES